MKVLVQDLRTREFRCRDGSRSINRDRARCFSSARDAFWFGRRFARPFQLVFECDEGGAEATLLNSEGIYLS